MGRMSATRCVCSRPYTRLSSSARHDASMMFGLTPMVVHVAFAVGGVEQHTSDGAGRRAAVEDAHLEVGEVHRGRAAGSIDRSPGAAPSRWR